MHFNTIQAAVAATTLFLAFAEAQTTTTCQPLNQTCPNDEGLASSSYFVDFTKTKSLPSDWSLALNEKVDFGAQGAELTFAKQHDAPTMYTNFKFLFGHVDYVVQAAPGKGIISSMVLLSDDLDEIDWEIIGVQNDQVETNYFGKGVVNYNVAEYVSCQSPQSQFHTYSLDWSPEQIAWSIDGVTKRVLTPKQAGNEYPQTPMKVSLSLWDAGDPSEPEGTRTWAGGKTDIPPPQPYTMYVKSVKITNKTPAQQYQWLDKSGSWQSIKVINEPFNKTDTVPKSTSIVASIPLAPSTSVNIPTASGSVPALSTGSSQAGNHTGTATNSSAGGVMGAGSLAGLPKDAKLPQSTHDVLTTEIIHTTVTTCPVTHTPSGSHQGTVPIVTNTVSTIYSTAISTICTRCVAPSPSSIAPSSSVPVSSPSTGSSTPSQPKSQSISSAAPQPKTQEVVTTEIVHTTLTSCPITLTSTPISGGVPTTQVTHTISTLTTTLTSTLCTKCIAPTASPSPSLSSAPAQLPTSHLSNSPSVIPIPIPANTPLGTGTGMPSPLFQLPPPSKISALAASASSQKTRTEHLTLHMTSYLTSSTYVPLSTGTGVAAAAAPNANATVSGSGLKGSKTGPTVMAFKGDAASSRGFGASVVMVVGVCIAVLGGL